MAHGLLLSDMDLMGDLIKLNLSASNGCKITRVKNLETLSSLLAIEDSYELVIANTTIGNTDVVAKVLDICSKRLPHVPIVFMGHLDEKHIIHTIYNIPHYEDIYSLISLTAKLLKLISMNNPPRKEDEYFAIPIQLLVSSIALEDLWRISTVGDENFYRVALKGENIDAKREDWKKNGLQKLYIESKNTLAVTENITLSILEKINSNKLSAHEALATTNLLIASIAKDQRLIDSLSDTTKKAITDASKKMENVVKSIVSEFPPELKNLVDQMNRSKNNYIQNHIVLVTYFAQEICRQESWYSLETASKLFMLIYFHDIILVPIYEKYPDAPRNDYQLKTHDKLSKEEIETVSLHPHLASQLVKKLPSMPIGLDQLILQHHGNFSGVIDLAPPKEEIAPLAKVVYVAEHFAHALMNRTIPLDEKEYKDLLDALSNRLQKKSYQKLLKPLYLLKP